MTNYIKDFDNWNKIKKGIENGEKKIRYPKERQIRYIKLWVNLWFEADGKSEFTRPVLIVKKVGSLFWCIPMTTKGKLNKFYYRLQSVNFWKDIESSLMLSQARIIDGKRLEEMIWYISEEEFKIIKKLLNDLYL